VYGSSLLKAKTRVLMCNRFTCPATRAFVQFVAVVGGRLFGNLSEFWIFLYFASASCDSHLSVRVTSHVNTTFRMKWPDFEK